MKKIKKSLSLLTAVLMLCCILPFQAFALGSSEVKPCDEPEIWDGSIAEGFASGTGSEDEPYLISNGSELAYLSEQVNSGNHYENKCFELTNDIYINDPINWDSWEMSPPVNEFNAIGYYSYDWDTGVETDAFFGGNFNGNNYAVIGLYINKTEEIDENRFQGLFGKTNDAIISNLGIKNSYIHGYIGIGSIVGYAFFGTMVTGCYNTGFVSGTESSGGIVGINCGAISNCYNRGCVNSSTDKAGGIVGFNSADSIITGCYNTGDISCDSISFFGFSEVGGIVGCNTDTVTNCYNVGNVSGIKNIGGIIGSNGGTTTTSYNIGIVDGDTNVGGAIGINNCEAFGGVSDGIAENVYYLDTCCAYIDTVAIPLTDAQMCVEESYTGFDFENIWTMEGNPDYPYAELLGNNHNDGEEPPAPPTEPPTEEPPTEEPPTEEPPTEEPPTEEPPTEEPPTEEPPTEEPPTEEPPTEEPPTEEPPTEEPPTEEPPTEEPPTETPTEPPAPPTTGFISLAGAGVAAILAGAGVVLFKRKRS